MKEEEAVPLLPIEQPRSTGLKGVLFMFLAALSLVSARLRSDFVTFIWSLLANLLITSLFERDAKHLFVK